MSTHDWTTEQRLTVEIRKALNAARRSGEPTDFAELAPSVLLPNLEVAPGESVCSIVTNTAGRRFCFSEKSMYLEEGRAFRRVPFDSVVSFDWIDDSGDARTKLALKRQHGDRLVIRTSDGARHELDGLGSAFQGLFSFFDWLLARHQSAGW